MEGSCQKGFAIRPRIIIHGGAGNIQRENLPENAYREYKRVLLQIIRDAQFRLSLPGATALDVATFAVTQLENNSLFNAGHGAVFTTTGKHELEASVMVSRGFRKRGVGVMGVSRVRNPIMLAREMLIRGEQDHGGGAGLHNQLHGQICEQLATAWNLDLAKPSHFWTRRRWDEHRRGLGLSHDDETYEKAKKNADLDVVTPASDDIFDATNSDLTNHDPTWAGHEYLPQGTVGAVVLDNTGTLCVATSTGGLTNKLPGRIGDTPTLGAGFWAEEWHEKIVRYQQASDRPFNVLSSIPRWIQSCVPQIGGYESTPSDDLVYEKEQTLSTRAVAISGTGNGDSFLRTNAARTAASIARFAAADERSTGNSRKPTSLKCAVNKVVGPGGLLQESAGDHWKVTGEGEGGMIGIELIEGRGVLVADFNCGGMFRAWIDEYNEPHMAVF